MIPLPIGEARELLGVDHTIAGIHARQVDLANKLNRRRLIGIVGAAVHLYRVDAVLVHAL